MYVTSKAGFKMISAKFFVIINSPDDIVRANHACAWRRFGVN